MVPRLRDQTKAFEVGEGQRLRSILIRVGPTCMLDLRRTALFIHMKFEAFLAKHNDK